MFVRGTAKLRPAVTKLRSSLYVKPPGSTGIMWRHSWPSTRARNSESNRQPQLNVPRSKSLSRHSRYLRLREISTASALAVASKDPRLEAGIETWIGGMLDILGDVGKALNHFQRALALARAGGWRLAEGNALASIGKIYTDVADWQKALEFHNQALPLFRALGHKQNEAITLNNLGLVYCFIGDRK